MKNIRCWSIISLVLATSAFGQYHGTFTQTITSVSNTSLYQVGTTYYGQYWYESPTVDGTFEVLPFMWPLESTLHGLIFAPFVDRESQAYRGKWWSLTDTVNYGQLVVTNGTVTSFNWSFENGGYYLGANGAPKGVFAAYSYYDHPIYEPETGQFDPTPAVAGTITFDAPRVPDAASTAWLLLPCLMGVAVASRRRK